MTEEQRRQQQEAARDVVEGMKRRVSSLEEAIDGEDWQKAAEILGQMAQGAAVARIACLAAANLQAERN